MQHIIPHLWWNTEAKEATAFYTTVFPDSRVTQVTKLSGTPSGDTDIVEFQLSGIPMMGISAGPYFALNPAISLFATFSDVASTDRAWEALSEGGQVLMPYQSYPWATKYGWVNDRFGLSWQISCTDSLGARVTITPSLLFTGSKAGKAKEAIAFYASLFPSSHVDLEVPYEEGDGDTVGFLKHARFTLHGQEFIAMDSSLPHAFQFNEAFSLLVECDTQEEMDTLSDALSFVPESEQCGWVKDKYGVSWQIAPKEMRVMMKEGTPEQLARLTEAFLSMKRFNLDALRKAYRGE
jgi:predicted 3-demethylubiquinone-9 3-methyltransferase (glyoxalase superfamily)